MSFNVDTELYVKDAVMCEYDNAIAYNAKLHKGEVYNTAHEGYAILLEELHEVKSCINDIERKLASVWSKITDVENPLEYRDWIGKDILSVKYNAMEAMMELAQVAACSMKFYDTFEGDNERRLD